MAEPRLFIRKGVTDNAVQYGKTKGNDGNRTSSPLETSQKKQGRVEYVKNTTRPFCLKAPKTNADDGKSLIMADNQPSPKELAAADCAYWANLYQLRLQAGPFTFQGHEYLIDPLQSKNQIEVVMKATQGGFTETEVLRTLHGCIYGHYPQGVLYLFPTTDDVQDFSKSRFNSLINNNPEAIGKYVRSGGGKGTDSAQLKRVANSFLYFRGAVLNKESGEGNEYKSSSKLKGIPVDAIRYDEWDEMEEEVREKAKGRFGHSLIKEERFLSNPRIPDMGIDALFQQSTQHHWFRKCSCKSGDLHAWTCAELTFPDCVRIRDDGTGYIACHNCGSPLPVFPAKWIPSYRDRPIVGRRWSQLSSIFNDPADILEDFVNPKDGNLADVYRLRLGLPYVSKEDQLRKSQIYECCSPDLMKATDSGPCAMGVDVGQMFHVVIGSRIGKDRYEIYYIAQLPASTAWSDLHELGKKFGVKSGVVDIRPYEDSAREFQKQESYSLYLCSYNENTVRDVDFNKQTGIVSVNRTQIFDQSHRVIANQDIVLPKRCPKIEEFAKQLCNAYKLMEENKKTGLKVMRYKGRNEHYRNALNYFLLAASPKRIGQRKSLIQRMMSKNRGNFANNNYNRSRF